MDDDDKFPIIEG